MADMGLRAGADVTVWIADGSTQVLGKIEAVYGPGAEPLALSVNGPHGLYLVPWRSIVAIRFGPPADAA